ncbi:hypothetical protein VPHD171_0037 [Vibrio phage D171]
MILSIIGLVLFALAIVCMVISMDRSTEGKGIKLSLSLTILFAILAMLTGIISLASTITKLTNG